MTKNKRYTVKILFFAIEDERRFIHHCYYGLTKSEAEKQYETCANLALEANHNVWNVEVRMYEEADDA